MTKLTKELVDYHYNQMGLSLRKVAKITGVPLATLYVFMRDNNIQMRDKSKAQKHYLEDNEHPMLGKNHSESTRRKISHSLEEFWNGISPQEREEYKARIGSAWKNKWASMTDEEKENMLAMLSEKSKETKGSSKLEKFIAQSLRDAGFLVEEKTANYTPGNQFEIDIALPKFGIMIEVDGPTHFKPIYGEESLLRQQERDERKNAIIIGAGLNLLRIQDDNGPISALRFRKILKVIEQIKKSKTRKVWYIQ